MAVTQTEMKANVARLRHGEWDAALQTYFEQLSAKELTDGLRPDYPVVFQERRIGRKHEVGFASEVVYELRVRKMPQSLFAGMYLLPTLRHCWLISSYDDALSELTWVNRIRVKPQKGNGKLIAISFGSGIKVDRSVDGWVKKPVGTGGAPLSEDALKKHGWQFDLLQPFGLRRAAAKP